jgi:hypothetical protein
MKKLTNIRPQRHHREHFAVPRNPKLVGQWQRGIEKMSGQARWKLHLTFAHSPTPALPTVNQQYCHDHDVDLLDFSSRAVRLQRRRA